MEHTGPYALYETDPKKESGKGVKITFGSFWFQILRAGASNPKFLAASIQHTKRFEEAVQQKSMTEEQANELMAEVYADSIIIDWGGVVDRKGVPMSYTRDNVVTLLCDLPELAAKIRAKAEGIALFRMEANKKAVKKQ